MTPFHRTQAAALQQAHKASNARRGRAALLVLCGLAPITTCLAAGGHHAVDDAGILERGACEAESWASRDSDGGRLLHAGLGCGIGLLELGVAGEYARADGASQTGWAVQAKAAHPLTETVAVGLALQAGWQPRLRPRYAGSSVLALLSWSAHEQVAVHLNLGRDFAPGAADENRGGVAVEWAPTARWSLLAERYKEQGTHFVRGGVRWLPAQGWQVDLSRAQRLSGPSPSGWTLGLTYAWE